MGTYSTDLTTLTTAESGTLTEFTDLSGGGAPGQSGEQFIQGTDCFSQNTGNKGVGLALSLVYDHGANVTFAAGEVVFAWLFYFAGTNLETYANSGWRFGIGSSASAYDWFRVGGSDYSSQKYGGWFNFAIDPTATESGVSGGGNGGSYRYFGNIPYTLNAVTKGDPVAMDAIRYGRGTISVTGTGGSFLEMSQYNDYNGGATPPGTGSTSIDSGRHVLGLFQAAGGGYLWKGLMSMGLTGTSVTFTDSNVTITIDDCPHTYADFNKIEIHNAASSVTWTNITFISTATTANGVGYFEMVDNATVNLNGCSFNGLGTFIFQSNAVVDSTFNGCGQITHGGANMSRSTINEYEGTAGTGAVLYNVAADPDGEMDNMAFTMGATSTHAIEFGTNAPNTMTLRGIDFIGYNTTNGDAGIANDAVLSFPDKGTDTTWTINIIGGSGTISYTKARAGDTVNIVQNPVTFKIVVQNTAGTKIQDARVLALAATGGSYPVEEVVTITSSGTTASVSHTAHGMVNGDKVVIEGASPNQFNGVYTISNVTTNAYDYTFAGNGGSPATGTILATTAIISGLTDVNGEIQDSRTYAVSQPVGGRVRKSTSAPYYKTAQITGTIDSASGLTLTVVMLSDE